MQNGKEAVELLVEKDLQKALTEANRINEYNEQRKDVDKEMTKEANEIVARLESQQHMQSIVLYDEGWKKGVVGIVASRLTEPLPSYRCPDHHRRYRLRLCTQCRRLRHLRCHQELP